MVSKGLWTILGLKAMPVALFWGSRGLLMDLQPPRAVLGAQNGRSPREEDQKRPLRGPERFFYVARRTDLCRI